MKMSELRVGLPVIYIGTVRERCHALLTAVHGNITFEEDGETIKYYPAVNLVFVCPDDDRGDQYGRQTVHESSIGHANDQHPAVGNCYYLPDQEVVIDEANVQTQK